MDPRLELGIGPRPIAIDDRRFFAEDAGAALQKAQRREVGAMDLGRKHRHGWTNPYVEQNAPTKIG